MPRGFLKLPTGQVDKNGKPIMERITEADYEYRQWKKKRDAAAARESAAKPPQATGGGGSVTEPGV